MSFHPHHLHRPLLLLPLSAQRKMFAFNDSAAAAITIGEAADAAGATVAGADAAPAAGAAAAVLNNLTRTAQLEHHVQQLLDTWRFQVCCA